MTLRQSSRLGSVRMSNERPSDMKVIRESSKLFCSVLLFSPSFHPLLFIPSSQAPIYAHLTTLIRLQNLLYAPSPHPRPIAPHTAGPASPRLRIGLSILCHHRGAIPVSGQHGDRKCGGGISVSLARRAWRPRDGDFWEGKACARGAGGLVMTSLGICNRWWSCPFVRRVWE